jgi:hypothetical protein
MGVYFSTLMLIPKAYFQVNQKALRFVIFSTIEVNASMSLILWFVVVPKEGAI